MDKVMSKSNKYQLYFIFLFVVIYSSCDKLLMKTEENNKPTVTIKVEDETPSINSTQTFTAEVVDPDEGDSVTVSWTVTAGKLENDVGASVSWTAPSDTQVVKITALAMDTESARDLDNKILTVGNEKPTINSFSSSTIYILTGNSVTLTCDATDTEGNNLTYKFSVEPNEGEIQHSSSHSNEAVWNSPEDMAQSAKNYKLIVNVADILGVNVSDTIEVLVYYEYGTIWVVDSGQQAVIKYAANGKKILTAAQNFTKPVAVTNNIDEFYGCYVADYGDNSIHKINSAGETVVSYSGIPNVIDIAVHNDTRTLWAISVGENTLTVLDGFTDLEIKKIYGFQKPRTIMINQASDDVWIVETGNNRVIKFNAYDLPTSLPDTISHENTVIFPDDSSGTIFNAPFGQYSRSQSNETVYIADKNDNEIERLIWEENKYVRAENPISIMPKRPMYVSVSMLANVGWTVFVMNTDGKIVVFPEKNITDIKTSPGDYFFEYPHALATDEGNCEFWIGDNGTNQLIKIKMNPDYTFKTLAEVSGFMFIEDVIINK